MSRQTTSRFSSRPSSASPNMRGKNPKRDKSELLEEKLKKASVQIKALEMKLLHQQEQTHRVNSNRGELMDKIELIKGDLEQEKEEHFSIFSEMTRQYKTMERMLMEKINELEVDNAELSEQLELSHLILEETRKEKDRQLAERDAIIAEQSRKMEHMALEFADMLKETLEKMGEKIEEAAKHANETSLLSPEYISKLQEFNVHIS